MARIAGVNIPTGKPVWIALRYIYGVGPKRARDICNELKIPDSKRVNQLTDNEVLKIREFIDKSYKVEGDLRRDIAMNNQAPDGSGLLPRPAPSQGPAGSWPAHAH